MFVLYSLFFMAYFARKIYLKKSKALKRNCTFCFRMKISRTKPGLSDFGMETKIDCWFNVYLSMLNWLGFFYILGNYVSFYVCLKPHKRGVILCKISFEKRMMV